MAAEEDCVLALLLRETEADELPEEDLREAALPETELLLEEEPLF